MNLSSKSAISCAAISAAALLGRETSRAQLPDPPSSNTSTSTLFQSVSRSTERELAALRLSLSQEIHESIRQEIIAEKELLQNTASFRKDALLDTNEKLTKALEGNDQSEIASAFLRYTKEKDTENFYRLLRLSFCVFGPLITMSAAYCLLDSSKFKRQIEAIISRPFGLTLSEKEFLHDHFVQSKGSLDTIKRGLDVLALVHNASREWNKDDVKQLLNQKKNQAWCCSFGATLTLVGVVLFSGDFIYTVKAFINIAILFGLSTVLLNRYSLDRRGLIMKAAYSESQREKEAAHLASMKTE